MGIFQCRVVLLIWIIVGQGRIVLAVGAGGGCCIFFLAPTFLFPPPTLWDGWIDDVILRLFNRISVISERL